MIIGKIGIADIQIDVTSRDDIPTILLGLQFRQMCPALPFNTDIKKPPKPVKDGLCAI